MVRALFVTLEVAGLLLITAGVYMFSQAMALMVLGAGILAGSYLYNR